MNANGAFLGIVHEGQFHMLDPKPAGDIPTRLTTIQMQAAVPPESGELDLGTYEGKAIMVYGHDGGGWIYSAVVIDQAGPILTAVVRKVFSQ